MTLADGNSAEALMVKVRHLAIGRSTPIARFDSIFEAACLRTLLPTHTFSFDYISGEVVNHVILKLMFLRVLSLSGRRKLKQLPESIGEQRHLRHLDLSGTSIERLEDAKTCNLKSLQTLSTFIVGRDNAAKIGELRELQDLHGRLSFLKLNNVPGAKDALEATLMDKKYLEELDLAWKDDSNDSKHDQKALQYLSPHTKLERLFVYGYGGTTFPNWLGYRSFCNMVFIMLSNCKYCNCLPPLGQLPSLKTLYIEQLSGVVSVGAEFYGSSERNPFASLKFLSFSKMSNWEEWSSIEVEDREVFPKLQELEIRECHRLMNVHWPRSLPRLTKLRIFRIFGKVLVPSLPSTPAIRKLELGMCEKLQLQEVPQTVEWFTIGGSHGVELFTDILRKSQTCLLVVLAHLNFCPLDFIPNLKDLVIKGSKNLESLTVSDGQLCQNLTTLTIGGPNFISFPKGGLPAPNLISLGVTGCKKLKMLPEQMHNLLPSLQELYISDCLELESFPEGGLASNISRLDVRKCSKLIAERMKWNLQTLQALTRYLPSKIMKVQVWNHFRRRGCYLAILNVFISLDLKVLTDWT
nr:putative disease resistance protein At3g14460 [Ziziphus jujuba var. spinosa]